jgi:hypothetical protein
MNLSRSGSTAGGRAGAAGPSLDAGASTASPAQSQSPSSGGDTDRAELTALKKRLEEVEQQLAKAQTGAAIAYDSSSGREALLNEIFDRPVAIGYRSVRLDFDDLKSQK